MGDSQSAVRVAVVHGKMYLNGTFASCCCFRVGDGEKVRYWEESWVGVILRDSFLSSS